MSEVVDDIIEAHEAGVEIGRALERVADAAEKLMACGITKRAIIVLLKDRLHHIRIGDIEAVINALPELRRYLSEP